MKTIKTITVALAIAITANTSANVFPGYQWEKAAASVGIDPVILYAVALAESASYRGLNITSPWPYAIRNGESATYADTKEEAEILLEQAFQDVEGQAVQHWRLCHGADNRFLVQDVWCFFLQQALELRHRRILVCSNRLRIQQLFGEDKL